MNNYNSSYETCLSRVENVFTQYNTAVIIYKSQEQMSSYRCW